MQLIIIVSKYAYEAQPITARNHGYKEHRYNPKGRVDRTSEKEKQPAQKSDHHHSLYA